MTVPLDLIATLSGEQKSPVTASGLAPFKRKGDASEREKKKYLNSRILHKSQKRKVSIDFFFIIHDQGGFRLSCESNECAKYFTLFVPSEVFGWPENETQENETERAFNKEWLFAWNVPDR
jgi:hypothetical protein